MTLKASAFLKTDAENWRCCPHTALISGQRRAGLPAGMRLMRRMGPEVAASRL
jgi:hypothetical protein